jgi:hypothetical protein
MKEVTLKPGEKFLFDGHVHPIINRSEWDMIVRAEDNGSVYVTPMRPVPEVEPMMISTVLR